MRILVFASSFAPYAGGVATFNAHLLPRLVERGHRCLVVTSHHEARLADEAVIDGSRVVRLPMRRALVNRDPEMFLVAKHRVAALKREFAAERYHVHLDGPDVIFHHATSAVAPAPTVLTAHGEPFGDLTDARSVLPRALSSADWMTGPSRSVLDPYVAAAPWVAARSTVIPNGIVPTSVAPTPLPQAPVLLWLGRVMPEKGLDVAIAALARVPRTDVSLVVAGDGAARADCEALAHALGVGDRVSFLGTVGADEVPGLINRCSLLIVSSRAEGFGYVVLEAARQQRAVIASRVGGLPDVVADGETGLLVSPEDPQTLAQAIARLVDDPVMLRQMGHAAEQRTEALFGASRMAEAYDALYSSDLLTQLDWRTHDGRREDVSGQRT